MTTFSEKVRQHNMNNKLYRKDFVETRTAISTGKIINFGELYRKLMIWVNDIKFENGIYTEFKPSRLEYDDSNPMNIVCMAYNEDGYITHKNIMKHNAMNMFHNIETTTYYYDTTGEKPVLSLEISTSTNNYNRITGVVSHFRDREIHYYNFGDGLKLKEVRLVYPDRIGGTVYAEDPIQGLKVLYQRYERVISL